MTKSEFLNKIWSKKSIFFGIILILLLLIGANYIFNLSSSKKKITPFVTFPSEGEYVHGQVIVAFRDGYIPKQLEKEIEDEKNKNFVNRLEATFKNEKSAEEKIKSIQKEFNQIGIADYKPEFEGDAEKLNKFYILFYDSKIPIENIQDHLKKMSFLESSEPNSVVHIFATPNDPNYPQLWGIQKIQAPQAWDTTTGSDSIVVADIDTGVDLSHPDLSVNLVSGWNFINNTNNPQDDNDHGTHIAGTIGGVGNNGVGVVGVNWRVKIMPIKVMNSSGIGNADMIRQGIQYAADNGAKVANLSLGSLGACTSAYQGTVDYAISKGTTLVIAAGNEKEDASSYRPGNCNGVITVGSSNSSDQRSIFSAAKASNYGNTVEIAAPGSSIYSTIRGGYGSMSGTSMATPHVAGAAALLLSVNPNLTSQQVTNCLVQNADPISTDKWIGPRLNIFRAITACSGGPLPTLPVGATPTLPVGATPTLPVGATPTLTLAPTSGGGGGGGVLTPIPTPIATFTCDIDRNNCPQGQKNLQLCPLICRPI